MGIPRVHTPLRSRWLRASLISWLVAATFLAFAHPSAAQPQAPGDELWANLLNLPGGGSYVTFSLGVSPDGARVFVLGTASDGLALVAHDAATGDQLWVIVLTGFYTGALVVSPDGQKVYVTGTSDSVDYVVAAHDAATGDQLWVSYYRVSTDEPSSIAVSPDGASVFVTGFSYGNGTDYDYATVGFDAATGHRLWARRYNGPGNGFDAGLAVGVSPDSTKVFVTGYSVGRRTGYDIATVAYDAATGTPLWVKRLASQGMNTDIGYSLDISPDGMRVFVTGENQESAFVTVAYDAQSGARLWLAIFQEGIRARSIRVSPDGARVFVTGEGYRSGYDYATVSYDAMAGGQLWASFYDGGDVDRSYSLGVSPDGAAVYVTGESEGVAGGFDYATVAYDSVGGGQLWASRYNGPGDGSDSAHAIGVSPDGSRVFVTGTSSLDIATVAYSG